MLICDGCKLMIDSKSLPSFSAALYVESYATTINAQVDFSQRPSGFPHDPDPTKIDFCEKCTKKMLFAALDEELRPLTIAERKGTR